MVSCFVQPQCGQVSADSRTMAFIAASHEISRPAPDIFGCSEDEFEPPERDHLPLAHVAISSAA